MIIIGLTGSIGMGKTETGRMFERLGVPVFDADKAVHQLYGPDGAAVAPIEAAFPGVVVDGAVDRAALAARVLGDEAAVRRLEAIVHPLVQEMRARFLETASEEGRDMVVVDIPLLFETGGETRVDRTVVVSAPPSVQHERVLARPGMTEAKFQAILARQMPDEEKRKRADFVVDSSVGLDHAFAQVERIVASLRSGG
jgi:dephospho-CoA kinase